MKVRHCRKWSRYATVLAGALVLGPWLGLHAQTTTGTIRGVVTGTGGAPVGDVQVVARDVETNVSRGAVTNSQGVYSIGGLRPAGYEVVARRIGMAPATRNVRLQIGQSITLNIQLGEAAVQLTEVQVVAAPAAETRTSEVSTNVRQEQIEDLPTAGRNFLDLAVLAPGTRVNPDRLDGAGKTFAAQAQTADRINVFVDGASYKNDIISGGVAGQDASRGNPFPRNALQEFRITTTNFKAEYQKASSAIISAVTKSGTNEWTGSAFGEFLNESFVARDTFSRANPNFVKPELSRYLAGLSLGGPIVRDKTFFFGSYELNFQDREGVTRFNGDPATWPAAVTAVNNEIHTSPFRSHLFFAKVTHNPNDRHAFEITGDLRRENDDRRFGGQFGGREEAFSTGESFSNNVATGRVKHSYFAPSWVNEALLSYQWYNWKTEPFNPDLPALDYQGVGRLGGREASQDLSQGRLSLRNDFTYSGFEMAGSHAVKVGGNFDFVNYDLTKRFSENPIFVFNSSNNFANPIEARIGIGDPSVTQSNTQVGLYVQDDWSPTSRLMLNLGIRWDYESGMYNRDFVTPSNLVDSLTDYRDSLFIDIDPSRYFTDGDDREAFFGAFQPRIGASYALDERGRTVLFGGWGIFYDRLIFNATIDEAYNAQHPTYLFRFADTADPPNNVLAWDPQYFSRQGLLNAIASGVTPPTEVFLMPNDLKPPKSQQWSIGARQDFGSWNAALTYTGTRSENGFTYEWANHTLNPNGTCCVFRDFLVPAYRNVLVGYNDVRSWYDALFLQLDRPYRPVGTWNWGAGLAWTYTLKAEADGGDLFSFPNVRNQPRRPLGDFEKHRIVANWISDVPYAWGIQFSSLITLGTGRRLNREDFTGPVPIIERGVEDPEKFGFLIPDAFAYRTVDVRLRKDFPNFGGNRLGITLDVFNVFNWNNFGCFNQTFRIRNDQDQIVENPNYGNPGCVISDPRRAQLGLAYDFSAGGFAGIGGR